MRCCAQDGPQEDRAVGGVVLQAVALVADDKTVPLADLLADLLRHVKAGDRDLDLSQGASQLLLDVLADHTAKWASETLATAGDLHPKVWNATASSCLLGDVHSPFLVLVSCEIPTVDTANDDDLLWVPMHQHQHAILQSECIHAASTAQSKRSLTEPLMIVTTWRSMGGGSQVCRADSQSRRSVEGQMMSRGQSSLKAAAIMIACNFILRLGFLYDSFSYEGKRKSAGGNDARMLYLDGLAQAHLICQDNLGIAFDPEFNALPLVPAGNHAPRANSVSKDQTSCIAARTTDSRKELVPGLLRQLREALLHCLLAQHRHETLLFLQLQNSSQSQWSSKQRRSRGWLIGTHRGQCPKLPSIANPANLG